MHAQKSVLSADAAGREHAFWHEYLSDQTKKLTITSDESLHGLMVSERISKKSTDSRRCFFVVLCLDLKIRSQRENQVSTCGNQSGAIGPVALIGEVLQTCAYLHVFMELIHGLEIQGVPAR